MNVSLEQLSAAEREQATSPASGVPISETFVSVQGEGKLTGVPSWFVRFSGCNLRCTWCDTPYASWSPESERRTVESLVDEARDSGLRHAVVTGGEPMLFDAVEPLTQELRALGMHVTIETAGTIARPPAALACDLMSLSPKLANSTPYNDPRDPKGVWAERHEARRLDVETLQRLIDDYPDHHLKFVVASPADMPEIERLLGRLRGLEPRDVMLMPEGVTVPLAADVRWIVDLCIDRGWRYCPRLHIELFGDTRGT